MKKYVKDMTQGNPTKLLLSFMIPMVIGNFFQQLYNVIDSVVVGQVIGADALAAIGATSSLDFLFSSLCCGMSSGAGIVISQYLGAAEDENVKRTIANAAYITLAVGGITGGVGIFFSKSILISLNTPKEILDMSNAYMQIIYIGFLAVALYNCMAAVLRALGDSKTPLIFLVIASIFNITLDILFVKIFKMGVRGAALATIVAQLLSGVGCLLFAIFNNPYFKIGKKQFKFNYVIIKQCTRIGIPLAFQNSLIAFSCVALQSVVNTFGAVIVAAFTVTSRIEQLVEQPYNSLGMSLATYTGQNIGANKINRVKLRYRKALIIMLIYSIIMMPLAHYGGKIVVQMFVDEIQVIEYGAQALKITSCFYIFLGSIYVTRGLLNGAGDAAFAFINGIVEIFGRIFFAFLLTSVVGMGAWGIWMSTSATWVLTSVFNITRYFQGKWKKKII